jgi:hypothetical protein
VFLIKIIVDDFLMPLDAGKSNFAGLVSRLSSQANA